MRTILLQSNQDLLREINRLRSELPDVQIPSELIPYRDRVFSTCDSFREQVNQNLRDLDLNRDEILVDILSNTQEITRQFQLYNQHFVSPVFRSRQSDRLSLKVLRWLHVKHSQTRDLPAGLSDGDFGI